MAGATNRVTRSYTWDPTAVAGLGGLLAITAYGTDGQVSGVYLPVYDAAGNITAVVDKDSQAVIASSMYSAYGDLRTSFGRWDLCPFRFQTQYFDEETRLYAVGQGRYYSAELGRCLGRASTASGIPGYKEEFGGDPINASIPRLPSAVSDLAGNLARLAESQVGFAGAGFDGQLEKIRQASDALNALGVSARQHRYITGPMGQLALNQAYAQNYAQAEIQAWDQLGGGHKIALTGARIAGPVLALATLIPGPQMPVVAALAAGVNGFNAYAAGEGIVVSVGIGALNLIPLGSALGKAALAARAGVAGRATFTVGRAATVAAGETLELNLGIAEAVRASASTLNVGINAAVSVSRNALTQFSRFFYDARLFRVISREYWAGTAGGRSLHHWLIPQRAKWVPMGIRNAGFNLLELPSLRGVFHPTLSLNTWMGFAVKWNRPAAIKAAIVENAIRVGIPAMGAGAAYGGYQIGHEGYELLVGGD